MKTYRIQRLNPPPASEGHAKLTQVFGGEMLQLKDGAWSILQKIFDIDHMGNAEYEFGALPNCLLHIAQKVDSYAGWYFDLKVSDIKPGLWREHLVNELRRDEIDAAKKAGVKPPRRNNKKLAALAAEKAGPIKERRIFVYGPADQQIEVDAMIRTVGQGLMATKGDPRFYRALDPEPGYAVKTCGWLDLDNELFWFFDETMWQKTVDMFEGRGELERGAG